jgi:hypothetical protein
MIKRILISLFCLIFLLHSCREEYFADIDKYEDILVVDGTITNQPGPYEIRLSKSSPINRPELKPFAGAQVTVLDNLGNEEIFTEVSPGIHVSEEDGMQGVVGRKYKVVIATAADDVYESDFQVLQDPTGIGDVYAEIESKNSSDPFYPTYGYQFYVDSESSEADTVNLMWRLTGTYKYQSDFYIRYYYDYGLHEFPDADSLYTCYKTDVIQGIYTFSTAGLMDNEVKRLPLNYVTTDTRMLSIRYSLLVEQYTLPSEAYEYYNNLQTISAQQGLLYAQQPFQVRGNLKNATRPEEPILGYFLVAGMAQKRIFVNRPPSDKVEFYYGECVLSEADFEAYGYIRWTDRRTWPLYVTTSTSGRRALTHQDCVDCRKLGGIIEKPDFWIDD